MPTFDQKEFNRFAAKKTTLLEDKRLVISGRGTYFHSDWRSVLNDLFEMNTLINYILAFTNDKHLKPDCFYGVPENGSALAILTQNEWARRSPDYSPGSHRLPVGRKQTKNHGEAKDRYFVCEPKGKTILLEDTVTLEMPLLRELDKLEQMRDVEIIATLSLFNRQQKTPDDISIEQLIHGRGYKHYSMSYASKVLPIVFRQIGKPEKIKKLLEKEFQKYGVAELRLR
jgi:orotate phosphoribosyltransferase